MEFPPQLRCAVEELAAAEDIRLLTAAAQRLSERYRNESGSGKSLLGGYTDALAYAAVRMPATFGAVSRALELTLECFDGEISSMLDIGAGTGAACLAARLLTGCEDITCIERDSDMTALGKRLTELCGILAEWLPLDVSESDKAPRAELVVSSYCLNELEPNKRPQAIKALWERAEKLLVIIEPGTPEGFSQIKKARELLISLGAETAAPCPHGSKCPLTEGDWCHFTCRVARSKLHKRLKGGEAPYEDEKFCFIAAAKLPCKRCESRILRHPVIEKGKVTLQLCESGGISERLITAKSTLFKTARKSSAGDSFG